MQQEFVILVDEKDEQIGLMEKLEAHQKGLLHRAFSVFAFNDANELLLHQRAAGKYHSPGCWTNTCCSHPRENETILEAGNRRLQEEMGMQCVLEPVFSFIYRAEFDNGLIEHELDHVLLGRFSGKPYPNAEEAQDWKYISLEQLQKEINETPERFTPWLRIILAQHLEKILQWLG